jgi:hypothetical protein
MYISKILPAFVDLKSEGALPYSVVHAVSLFMHGWSVCGLYLPHHHNIRNNDRAHWPHTTVCVTSGKFLSSIVIEQL